MDTIHEYLKTEQDMIRMQSNPEVAKFMEILNQRNVLLEKLKAETKEKGESIDLPYFKMKIVPKTKHHYQFYLNKMKNELWFNSVITVDEKKFFAETKKQCEAGELDPDKVETFYTDLPNHFFSAEITLLDLEQIQNLAL
jgi:hypothetical protein